MTSQTRPRPEEFFLAVLWIVGTAWWGYFGIVGYAENLTNLTGPAFNLTGFVLSFFLLCLTVFGLRFVFNTFLRVWSRQPVWLDIFSGFVLGLTLLAGWGFSLFSLVITLIHLFTDRITNLIFGWGLAACVCILGLAFFQLLAALHTLEPYLGRATYESTGGGRGPLGWMRQFQHRLYGRSSESARRGDQMQGPLLLESDTRTNLIEEKSGGRPGLEKTLVAPGGFHVSTLGFTANGATIFSVSDGGMVHFQAGGRKGTMFPPEVKFWEWAGNRVQTAALGKPQTFMTSHFQTPPDLHNYRFMVPQSGGKFAWALPHQIKVANWHNDQTKTLEVEEGLVLRGHGGFVPLSFNPEGSRLAWCTTEGQIRLWDLESDQVQPLRSYPVEHPEATTGTERGVWGLVFSPDGTRIATLGGRGILLQNVYTGWRWFRAIDSTTEKLTAFAFSNSGFEMAVALCVLPASVQHSKSPRRNQNGSHPAPRVTVPASPTAGTEGENKLWPIVRVWDLREDRYVDLLAGETPLREMAYSPDNELLAGVDEAGLLWLWETSPQGSSNHLPRLLLQIDVGLTGRKVVLNFSPGLERLLCATDNRILSWNLARLRQMTRENKTNQTV